MAATVAVALAGISPADTLELKNGQIVQGQFVGGSPLNIRFRVNGQEQVFAAKDVLNIGFSETTDASNAASAPQPAPALTYLAQKVGTVLAAAELDCVPDRGASLFCRVFFIGTLTEILLARLSR
jgi:hypothetical protein